MKKLIFTSLAALVLGLVPALTNAATTGKVTVIKQVVNIHGQTKTSADFSITGTAFGGFLAPYIDTYSVTFPGNASGTLAKIGAGTYHFTEVTDPNYTVSYSPDCSGIIVPGDVKTCTIINSDIGADVTVKVNVNNTNGGSKVASDFTVNFAAANGIISPVSDPASISFLGNTSGTIVGLNAGTYGVTLNAMSGYTFSYSADCNGTAVNPSSAICTVTAQDVAGSGGGGGSGGSGGGGGGGGLPLAPTPTPTGIVAGATTNTPNTPNTPAPGAGDPKVLGAATELPRTGLPFALVLLPSALAATLAFKKKKI